MADRTALIVDDEPDIREVLGLSLGTMGVEVQGAGNLAEARGLLKSCQFDICITDMRLPDGNGIQLVEHIQAHCPDLPTAVITAYGNVERAVQALKAGAFDFVSKPVDLNVLRRLVETALRMKPEGANANKAESLLLGRSDAMVKVRKKSLSMGHDMMVSE